MNEQSVWVVAVIFGLPTLLVGGALVGAGLGPARRRAVEKFMLLPLVVLLGVGGLAVAVGQHRWLGVALIALSTAMILGRLIGPASRPS